jgi:transposase
MLKLTSQQLDWICERIPDHPKGKLGGRPCADKRGVVEGIFWILDHGAKWKDLPARFGSKSTVHRWFRKWAISGVFEDVLRAAGQFVEERGGFRLYECFIDASFSRAKGGGPGVGLTRIGKGVKLMILVDAQGLPVSAYTAPANRAENHLAQQVFDFMLPSATPERIIGDKAYDSNRLADFFADHDVELIAAHRAKRRPENKTQDGRALRRARRRWTVERTIAWLQNYRRLCIRWERSTALFQGLLHLSCAHLLLKWVLG